MRYGFTTGSCAAAAAKAATYMLLLGKQKENIVIMTPKGIPYHAQILEQVRQETSVSCAVRKDGGDDPDITTGCLVFAKVTMESTDHTKEEACIIIEGGIGVGRVTKPGLDQPVGNAAINHVPREMITREVLEICHLTDFKGTLLVEISIPDGLTLAHLTFNKRLGIVGGISVLGTSGIVEPMSNQALLDTIKVELNVHKEGHKKIIAVSPGNYGLDFMKKSYDYDLDKSVKCSNFIGETIDMAIQCGFEKMLLTGHIGKMVKVAGGIMNTHSKNGDCRMELITAASLKAGAPIRVLQQILECITTTEAVRILKVNGFLSQTMDQLMGKIQFSLKKRAVGKIQIECLVYDNQFGELGASSGADQLLTELLKYKVE
ncbi:MAG: cobalt-precorrin-5B (C(1))-methyltransferase CbiD [Velocimicrobium sp.]